MKYIEMRNLKKIVLITSHKIEGLSLHGTLETAFSAKATAYIWCGNHNIILNDLHLSRHQTFNLLTNINNNTCVIGYNIKSTPVTQH